MKIKVVYLASLREQLGKSSEDLEIAPGVHGRRLARAPYARGVLATALAPRAGAARRRQPEIAQPATR